VSFSQSVSVFKFYQENPMNILNSRQLAVRVSLLSLTLLINSVSPAISAETSHQDHSPVSGLDEHEDNNDQHQEGVVSLTAEQMTTAGIVVEPLQLQLIHSFINAPGEATFNSYKTAVISPRISAQLIEQHVVLGESVRKGQVIVTLSSVDMAEAQAKVIMTYLDWTRIKSLGKKIIAEQRYLEAQIDWELAKAKAIAYGMTQDQINSLVKSNNFSRANGRFDLVALIDGTILKEDHLIGQQIEPGQELNVITDESSMWVIANVAPDIASEISVGNKASVQWANKSFPATVSQIYHNLDEVTRTSRIRLDVENDEDVLHSGLFVDTQIETSNQTKVLLVPESAVLRSAEGDWQVFVEQGEVGEFKGVEVKVIDTRNGKTTIEGLEVGTAVVVEGAFFVQSELSKSGFEIHNH
jgi:cobalt-zinc-cadmium efflux system membrane fusion protein